MSYFDNFIKMSVIFISYFRLCGVEGMRLGCSSSVVVIFISDSKLCGIEGMRLGSSSIVDNKIN